MVPSRMVEHLDEEDSDPRPWNQDDYFSHPTVPSVEHFGDEVQNNRNEHEGSGINDIIDFLKRTAPPPTNFMSIPDNFSISSQGSGNRWDKFKTKVFRRRRKPPKSKHRRPPLIKLPDSAVAARTIDGHRHIAISIPKRSSSLGPAPTIQTQTQIYDTTDTGLHRRTNSKFGIWRKSLTNRKMTVLNTVAEDRESISSTSSMPTTASEQPNQTALRSGPSIKPRPHSVSLLPSQEQRHDPVQVGADLAKSPSVGDTHPDFQPLSPISRPQSSEGRYLFMPATTAIEAGLVNRIIPNEVSSPLKDPETTRPSTSHSHNHSPPKPTIILTVPSRKSSRQGNQLERPATAPTGTETTTTTTAAAAAPEAAPANEDFLTSPRQGSYFSIGGSDDDGLSSGRDQPRTSFAASIETTNSSPQLLKAQTAVACHSVPTILVGHPPPADFAYLEPPPRSPARGDGGGNRIITTVATSRAIDSAAVAADAIAPPPLSAVNPIEGGLRQTDGAGEKEKKKENDEEEKTKIATPEKRRTPEKKKTTPEKKKNKNKKTREKSRDEEILVRDLMEKRHKSRSKSKGKERERERKRRKEYAPRLSRRPPPLVIPPSRHRRRRSREDYITTTNLTSTSTSASATDLDSHLASSRTSSPTRVYSSCSFSSSLSSLSTSSNPSPPRHSSSQYHRSSSGRTKSRSKSKSKSKHKSPKDKSHHHHHHPSTPSSHHNNHRHEHEHKPKSPPQLLPKAPSTPTHHETQHTRHLHSREKRLRRLERSRDAWVRAVPLLLHDLNKLLREQRRVLERVGLVVAGSGSDSDSSSGFEGRHRDNRDRDEKYRRHRHRYNHNHSHSHSHSHGHGHGHGRRQSRSRSTDEESSPSSVPSD